MVGRFLTDSEHAHYERASSCQRHHRVGIESAETAAGSAELDEMRLLGNCDSAFGYKFVGMDPCREGKPLYFYDADLWKNG